MKESKITLEEVFKEIDKSRQGDYSLTREETEIVRYGRKEVLGKQLCSFQKIALLIEELTGKSLNPDGLNKHWLREKTKYDKLYPIEEKI